MSGRLKDMVRRWLPTVAFAAAAIVAIHFVNAPHVVALSGDLPAFSGLTAAGATLSSADLRGKVAILNFWSPG